MCVGVGGSVPAPSAWRVSRVGSHSVQRVGTGQPPSGTSTFVPVTQRLRLFKGGTHVLSAFVAPATSHTVLDTQMLVLGGDHLLGDVEDRRREDPDGMEHLG